MRGRSADSPSLAMLFSHFTWRHWSQCPGSTWLLVGILALGVGVFLSIRLASRAAVTGFSLFTESLAGESDFTLRSPSGATLPESTLRDLREALNPLPVVIFPVVEATIADADGVADAPTSAAPLQIIGADLVALQNVAGAGFQGGLRSESSETRFELGSPTQAFVSAKFAKSREVLPGGTFPVGVNDRIVRLTVAGLLVDEPNRPAVPPNLILMDLPGAQSLLGMPNQISRIELRIPEGADSAAWREELGRRLSAAPDVLWIADTPDDRRDSAEKMTRAFRLNLAVLSTLALLVGIYLILQALEAAVVRRRPEIAILRSLGVEAITIRRLWMIESLVLGTVGGLLGVLLGWAGAQLAVGGIARTVSSLYHSTTTTAASLHPTEALIGIGFGVLSSLAAGWLPARDAAATPPAQMLRSGTRTEGFRFLARPTAGLVLAAAALIAGWLHPWTDSGGNQIPLGGYVAALLWVLALSSLASLGLRPFGHAIVRIAGRFPEAVMAASQLRRPTGRHRLAIAGLLAAVGMSAGMGILVHSFEGTLTGWISQMLRADLYVSPMGTGNATNSNRLPPETWRSLASDPAVEGVDVIRRYPVEFRGGTIRLAGSEYYGAKDRSMRMHWLQSPGNRPPQTFNGSLSDGIAPGWINESMSLRFELGIGDRVEIPTPSGLRQLEILGVYADYSDEAGTLLTLRRHTAEWFGDDTVSNLAAYLKPGSEISTVREQWQATHPALVIRENSRLREDALQTFHQTFAVTHSLEAIGVAVAVIGLGLSLASLMLERRNELATLKQIGFTRSQVARSAVIEGGALAMIGMAGGLSLSLILGALLIRVINRQSFGWTLDYRVPWLLLAGLALLTLATSTLASAVAGRRGARLKSDREE